MMLRNAAAVLILLLTVSSLQAQALHFAATGCGPYAPEEEPLLEHYVDLVNRDGQSEFLVHLGDVVTGKKKQWPESQYEKVASILKRCTRPVLVVLGDNEWNDLDNPAEGLTFWNRQLRDFDKHFPNSPKLQKQSVRSENFAFVSKGVLIIGLNLVGGRVHDKDEWALRLKHNADWVQEQFAAHRNDVRSVVILAQARPAKDHEMFFKPFTQSCIELGKPVLYLHADGHVWEVEKGWRAPNVWRVQTDQVKLNPPVLVTVTENAAEPFVFDRRMEIGSRRELFVDNWLIDQLNGVSRQLHKPVPQEVVITCDEAWEGNTSAYFTLLTDGARKRMYYRGSHYDEATQKGTHPMFTCYAESTDGVHWVKPKLGLVEYAGTKENNIILEGVGSINFTPFLDENPDCAPDARYKALAGDKTGLKAYKSSDGIHWSLIQDKPVITNGNFDSQNLAFWHPLQRRYVAYHRKTKDSIRDIMFSVSTDFLNWNDPRFLDYGESPKEHLYTNAIQPYSRAPHILLGFPTRYQPKTQQVEPVLMSSRDGLAFQRWSEELIPITAPKNRDGNRSNYMAHGLFQLSPDQLSLYATEAYYAGPGSRVRRFTLRTDGFVSIHADDTAGELLTKPFTFSGNALHLNYAAAGGGQVRVEIQDRWGQPIGGYRLADCTPLTVDKIDQGVVWKTTPATRLADLSGAPVRLRIELRNADLYSLKFEQR
ncbi:MAG: hypothetical protein IT423_04025 [Pirellulaceae bacterium]|nr:hypothetical protein [Pirellulaceae bacterium]